MNDVPEAASQNEAAVPETKACPIGAPEPPAGSGPPDARPESSGVSLPSAEAQEAILHHLREVEDKLDQLQSLFQERLSYDAAREAVIERLHAELQEYKGDMVLKILKPLCLSLIGVYDNMGKLIAANQPAAAESDAANRLLGVLAGFQADIENALYRHGFESFTVSEPHFDGKRQRIEETVATDDTALHQTVARRIRKGFAFEGRVVRPEVVAVYVAPPPPRV